MVSPMSQSIPLWSLQCTSASRCGLPCVPVHPAVVSPVSQRILLWSLPQDVGLNLMTRCQGCTHQGQSQSDKEVYLCRGKNCLLQSLRLGGRKTETCLRGSQREGWPLSWNARCSCRALSSELGLEETEEFCNYQGKPFLKFCC